MRTTSSAVGALSKASTPGNAGSMTCLSAQSVVNRLPPASTNARMRVTAAAETTPGQLTMSSCSGRRSSRSTVGRADDAVRHLEGAQHRLDVVVLPGDHDHVALDDLVENACPLRVVAHAAALS